MASIGLVTTDSAHVAATNTYNALVAKGHTVTVVTDASVTSTNLSSYDVIVVVRSAIAASVLRPYLDAGKPMLLATFMSGVVAGTGQSPQPTGLRLTGTYQLVDNASAQNESVIADEDHLVVEPYSLNQRVVVGSGGNYYAFLESGQSYVGTLLSTGDPDIAAAVGRPDGIAIESGTLDLDAVALGARVVILGWLYAGQSDYADDGKDILDRAIRWLDGTLVDPADITYVAYSGSVGAVWDRGMDVPMFMDPVTPFIDRYDPTSWRSGVTLPQQRVAWDDMEELVGTGGGGGGDTGGGESVTGSMLNRGLN